MMAWFMCIVLCQEWLTCYTRNAARAGKNCFLIGLLPGFVSAGVLHIFLIHHSGDDITTGNISALILLYSYVARTLLVMHSFIASRQVF